MKTIYINGRFLGAKLSGVPRYGRELLRELDTLLSDRRVESRVEVLIPKNVLERYNYKNITVRSVGRLTGHAWEQIELPFYAWDGVLFTPSGSAPLLHPRNVLTIHDAIVFAAPAGFSRAYVYWYRLLSLILCRTALRVITVSHFSKKELVSWCRAKPEKISVIYPGAQHMLKVPPDDGILTRYGLSRFGYALGVGSSSPNKNFRGLIAAIHFLQDSNITIALVGQTGTQVGQHGSPDSPLNTSSVTDLGHVTDSELRALFENAGCFVFPSFYEGFGLPPLEALSLGCPAVVANAASMPEVCGAVALLCNPSDARDIAEKIKQAVKLREDPRNAEIYIAFAARYSSVQCAHETLQLLEASLKEI